MRRSFQAVGICLMIFFHLAAGGASALEVAGIQMPDQLKAGNTDLLLNGAGVRKKYLLSFYAGGLYVKQRGTDGNRFVDADEPMIIRLHIVSDMISSKVMSDATLEGFENSTHGQTEPFKAQIERFLNVFSEEIRKNDIYDIVYRGDGLIEVFKNGKKAAVENGLDFKRTLFGIWLGEKMADRGLDRLREAMLNRE